jgi:hypothetical protein
MRRRLTPLRAATSFRSLGSLADSLKMDTALPSSLLVPAWWVQLPHAAALLYASSIL